MTRHMSEAERKSQILDAARTLFVEKGYLAARVEDIAKRAGLSKGAVYFYFSSKRAIFDTLAEQEYARTQSFLQRAQSTPVAASHKLMLLARQYLDYYAGVEDPPRFFLLMTEMAIRDQVIRERVHAIHDSYVSELAQIIDQGVAEGLFRPLHARSVAYLLKGLIDGLAGQAAAGVPPDAALLSTAGIDIVLHGVMARAGQAPGDPEHA